MKSQIAFLCFLICSLTFTGKALASIPEHEVREDKKEVWFMATLSVENWLFYDITTRDPGQVKTHIEPWKAKANEIHKKELEAMYPGYQVKAYFMNIRDIIFEFVEAEPDAYDFMDSLGSGWWAVSYKNVPRNRLNLLKTSLAQGPGLSVTVSLYKGDTIVKATPDIEYKFNLCDY